MGEAAIVENESLKTELMRTARRHRRINIGLLFNGLPQGEFFLLELLNKADQRGGALCVSDLAGSLKIAPPAVSRMLRDLERKALVCREADRADRRNTRVSLTEGGRQARNAAADRLDEFSNRVISRMGEADVKSLIALWNKMSDLMDEELRNMLEGDAQ